eukprot:12166989-Karenia_brevis.AAC.1
MEPGISSCRTQGFRCGELGHIGRHCPNNQSGAAPKAPPKNYFCQKVLVMQSLALHTSAGLASFASSHKTQVWCTSVLPVFAGVATLPCH